MEKWWRECAAKAIVVIIIVSMLVRCVSARNLTVGGASGWDLSSNIAAWSASTSFFVGDSLVFNYTPVYDVLEVNATDFKSCKTINPINVYTDGETVVHLTRPSTTMYFICGRSNHCSRGLKLRVRVLDSSNTTSSASNDHGKRRGGGGGGGPDKPEHRDPANPYGSNGNGGGEGGAHNPKPRSHAYPPRNDPKHRATATPTGQVHSSGVAALGEVNWWLDLHDQFIAVFVLVLLLMLLW